MGVDGVFEERVEVDGIEGDKGVIDEDEESSGKEENVGIEDSCDGSGDSRLDREGWLS